MRYALLSLLLAGTVYGQSVEITSSAAPPAVNTTTTEFTNVVTFSSTGDALGAGIYVDQGIVAGGLGLLNFDGFIYPNRGTNDHYKVWINSPTNDVDPHALGIWSPTNGSRAIHVYSGDLANTNMYHVFKLDVNDTGGADMQLYDGDENLVFEVDASSNQVNITSDMTIDGSLTTDILQFTGEGNIYTGGLDVATLKLSDLDLVIDMADSETSPWTYWGASGDTNAVGSWRQGVSGSNMLFQVKVGAGWTNAVEFTRP